MARELAHAARRRPDFTPQTEGLKAILPLVDDLADGSSVGAVTAHVLNLEGRRAA